MNKFLIALCVVVGVGMNPTPIQTPTAPPLPQVSTPPVKEVVEPTKTIKEEVQEVKQEVQKPVEPAWIQGEATAYYNGKDRMNGETGICANGVNLDNGTLYKGYHIIATDKRIPFGSIVEVKLSNGDTLQCVVCDRGGAIRGNHIDIVMRNRKECMRFGRQPMQYRIIGKVGK